jgi:hypothetical protein
MKLRAADAVVGVLVKRQRVGALLKQQAYHNALHESSANRLQFLRAEPVG